MSEPEGREHWGLPYEPLLSVLVTATEGRQDRWRRLRRDLDDQIGCCREAVELLIDAAPPHVPRTRQRQFLLDRSHGDYIAFVDASDTIAGDYIDALAEACRSGVDLITHGPAAPSPRWCWRRHIARQVGFAPDLGPGAAALWCQPLLHSGLIRRGRRIRRPLCRADPDDPRDDEQPPTAADFGAGLRCFRHVLGDILIEHPSVEHTTADQVLVRDAGNDLSLQLLEDLDCFHIVRPPDPPSEDG